ncbi:MAG: flavodoxin family protein [Eggerthellaceae bacterium]|nr:flavodoxin family protein [Eggerthellaceae bacterium]
MHRTILVGSPRSEGRSAHLADEIFQACLEDCPDDGASVVSISGIQVAPCIGCDACKRTLDAEDPLFPKIPDAHDPLRQNDLVFRSNANAHQCFMQDEQAEVRKHLDAADHVIVVSPVYFANVPAQLKCALDRLQPYFWSNIRSYTDRRRTFEVHVVGEDENPYGFAPLIGGLQSALGVAGFHLTAVHDWRGCISEDGEILADATEYDAEGNEVAPEMGDDDGYGQIL